MTNKIKDNESIPALARLWLRILAASPKVYLPGTQQEVGLLLVMVCIFMVIRVAIIQLLYHQFDFPVEGMETNFIASCLIGGIFHTPLLVPTAFMLLWHIPRKQYHPCAPISAHAQWWQDVCDGLIQFSTGYFLYDTIAGTYEQIVIPGVGIDWLFLGHHLASLYYLYSTRIVGAGQESLLLCIALGETTNPVFNAYLFCDTMRTSALITCSDATLNFCKYMDVICAIVYLPFRAVLIPIGASYMSFKMFCTSVGQKVSLGVRLFWNVTGWAIVLGSIPYIFTYIEILQKTAAGGDQEL